MKTILYIDGFNFYYSAVKGTSVRWVNPLALIARTFPLSQIVEAHRYLESNQQVGKVVVTV